MSFDSMQWCSYNQINNWTNVRAERIHARQLRARFTATLLFNLITQCVFNSCSFNYKLDYSKGPGHLAHCHPLSHEAIKRERRGEKKRVGKKERILCFYPRYLATKHFIPRSIYFHARFVTLNLNIFQCLKIFPLLKIYENKRWINLWINSLIHEIINFI